MDLCMGLGIGLGIGLVMGLAIGFRWNSTVHVAGQGVGIELELGWV